MVTAKGEDVCAIEKTKKGIGVVPVFSVSEKNCRMIRLLPKSSVEANEKGGQQ
jgi:hypothetical protein